MRKTTMMLAFGIALTFPAHAHDPAGLRLLAIRGKASVLAEGAQAWKSATAGQKLRKGECLRPMPGAVALLQDDEARFVTVRGPEVLCLSDAENAESLRSRIRGLLRDRDPRANVAVVIRG